MRARLITNDRLVHELVVVPLGERQPKRGPLVLHIGPVDAGEPVIPIMVPARIDPLRFDRPGL